MTSKLRHGVNISVRFALLILTFGSVLGLAACSRATDNSAAPKGSTVSITSISPSTGQFLVAGQTVKLKVGTAYWLSSETGSINLVVQTADAKSLAQDERVLKKGSGEVVFETEFVVPETSAVRVFIPLSGPDQNATSTLDTRVYSVSRK